MTSPTNFSDLRQSTLVTFDALPSGTHDSGNRDGGFINQTPAKGNFIVLECNRSEYIYMVSHNFIFHFFTWYTMVTNSTKKGTSMV